jgi:hypothetical protein
MVHDPEIWVARGVIGRDRLDDPPQERRALHEIGLGGERRPHGGLERPEPRAT